MDPHEYFDDPMDYVEYRDPSEAILDDLVPENPYDEPPDPLDEFRPENPYEECPDPLEGLFSEDHHDEYYDPMDDILNVHDNASEATSSLKAENITLKNQLETKTKNENAVLQELSRVRQENEQLKAQAGAQVMKKLSGCYPMKSSPCGIAVIINNRDFRSLATRHGTDKDAQSLECLFAYLGFSVHRHDNLTGNKMMRELTSVAAMNHSNFDCLMLAILTHGGEGNVLYGTDGTNIAVRDILHIFRADRCHSLAGKPKVIFLQACRGSMKDKGTKAATGTVDFMDECLLDSGPDKRKKGSRTNTIPVMADFLIVCSTFSGYVAYRNPESGSYFVSTLVDVLKKKSKDEHLSDMITEVIEQVSSLCISKAEKQVPQSKSSLRFKLYFNPSGSY